MSVVGRFQRHVRRISGSNGSFEPLAASVFRCPVARTHWTLCDVCPLARTSTETKVCGSFRRSRVAGTGEKNQHLSMLHTVGKLRGPTADLKGLVRDACQGSAERTCCCVRRSRSSATMSDGGRAAAAVGAHGVRRARRGSSKCENGPRARVSGSRSGVCVGPDRASPPRIHQRRLGEGSRVGGGRSPRAILMLWVVGRATDTRVARCVCRLDCGTGVERFVLFR